MSFFLSRCKTLFFALFFFSTLSAQNSQQLGGNGSDALSALAALQDGGRMGLLYYEQSCTLAGNTYQSAGGNDFLLIRWDSLWQVDWVVPISSSSALALEAFKALPDGSGYAAFQSNTTPSWSGQTQAAAPFSSLLYAWDAQGQLRWTYAWSSPLFQRISSLDSDGQNLYVGGYFSDVLNCADSSWQAPGLESPFLMRLDASGQLHWGRSIPHKANATAQIQALALLDGKCYAVGDFVDSMYIPADTLYAAGADPDIFLLCFDSLGQIQKSLSFNGIFSDRAGQLLADSPRQKLYLGGTLRGQLQLDSILLATAVSADDAFIAQIDSSGRVDWADKLYSQANNYSSALALGEGRIWQTGSFQDSFWVQGKSISAQAGFDSYVLGWDEQGSLLQALLLTGNGNVLSQALIAEAEESWVVGGNFSQTWQQFSALGPTDGFLFSDNLQLSPSSAPLPPLLEVKVFPNPSQTTLHIDSSRYQLRYWQLFDLSGRRCAEGTGFELQLQELPTGIYSLFIYFEEGLSIQKIQRQ